MALKRCSSKNVEIGGSDNAYVDDNSRLELQGHTVSRTVTVSAGGITMAPRERRVSAVSSHSGTLGHSAKERQRFPRLARPCCRSPGSAFGVSGEVAP